MHLLTKFAFLLALVSLHLTLKYACLYKKKTVCFIYPLIVILNINL